VIETRVLVVDDDPGIRRLLTEVLELADYTVEAAANGVEALEAIESHRPSVILLDMQMPVLDGKGVARALSERGERIPTVVMTAGDDAWRCCSELHADACLGKPFDLEDMLKTVARVHS
jgi:CheY-like chemotaxis protein